MNHISTVAVLLLAATGAPASTQRCPATAQLLAQASTFSTLFGATGCVTDSAKAFLVIYQAGDVEGLRRLARSPTAAGQLYGLCGLKHLRVEPDATKLRDAPSKSSKRTKIMFGDPYPQPLTEVRNLVVPMPGQTVSEFDATCDAMVKAGGSRGKHTCDPDSAQLTCR